MANTGGKYVRREMLDRWHVVESTIAGDAVTNCGLRMKDEPTPEGGGLVWTDALDETPLCITCGEGTLATPV